LLKSLAFAAALWLAVSAPTAAQSAPAILVGNVRDRTGEAVSGARIAAQDVQGRTIGGDVTDAEGTFAVRLLREAATIEIRCRHCASTRRNVRGQNDVAVIVQRYAALERDTPSPEDTAALPYPSAGELLGLIPFTLRPGGGISDRGLDRGQGVVVDDGAPIIDLATGAPALLDFPDRYVRTIAVAPPSVAFRYGPSAGAGRFALDQHNGDEGVASFDAGRTSSLALEPALGTLQPSAGVSSDDGILSRRADVDFATTFDGGFLRAGAGSTSSTSFVSGGDLARHLDLAHVAYATSSRRSRTFVDLSESSLHTRLLPANVYAASYLDAGVRVERPGPTTVAYGATLTQQNGSYGETYAGGLALSERVSSETLYAEAQTGTAGLAATAGLALSDVSARGAVLVPSATARASLGHELYARAGFSESLRVPSLLEALAAPVRPTSRALERGQLTEAAFGFNGNRLRAESLVFQQFLHGIGDYRLRGAGLSAVWQAAPQLSVRAWTLHDAPFDYVLPSSPQRNVERQIFWATYAPGTGIRFDAIAHREAGSGGVATGIDGDVWLQLQGQVALELGTSATTARKYYVGLRAKQR